MIVWLAHSRKHKAHQVYVRGAWRQSRFGATALCGRWVDPRTAVRRKEDALPPPWRCLDCISGSRMGTNWKYR
jgi:hypothetical protein